MSALRTPLVPLQAGWTQTGNTVDQSTATGGASEQRHGGRHPAACDPDAALMVRESGASAPQVFSGIPAY